MEKQIIQLLWELNKIKAEYIEYLKLSWFHKLWMDKMGIDYEMDMHEKLSQIKILQELNR